MAGELDIPAALGIRSVVFNPQYLSQTAPSVERGGNTYATDLGPALWRGTWQSGNLTPNEHGSVRGWLDALGTTGTFWAFDALREYPVCHPRGFGALGWNGVGTLAGVVNAKAVTISGLPAGLVLSAGDYLAFDYGAGGAKRALHRLSFGPVSPSGGSVTVTVAPRVRVGWSAGAPVYFARPACRMTVITDASQDAVDPTRIGRIAFTGLQSL